MPHFRFENISLVTALHRHSTQRERPHGQQRASSNLFLRPEAQRNKIERPGTQKKAPRMQQVCALLYISCSSSLEFLSPRNASEPNKSHRETHRDFYLLLYYTHICIRVHWAMWFFLGTKSRIRFRGAHNKIAELLEVSDHPCTRHVFVHRHTPNYLSSDRHADMPAPLGFSLGLEVSNRTEICARTTYSQTSDGPSPPPPRARPDRSIISLFSHHCVFHFKIIVLAATPVTQTLPIAHYFLV